MSQPAAAFAEKDILAQQAALQTMLSAGNTTDGFAPPGYATSLPILLEALGWRGSVRAVSEALPHFNDDLDLADLRRVLDNLGFRSRAIKIPLSNLDPRLLPCLYVTDAGDVFVATEAVDGTFRLFDCNRREPCNDFEVASAGTAYLVDRPKKAPAASGPEAPAHFSAMSRHLRSYLFHMLGISFVGNLLALAVPLMTMAVYDHVIGKQAPDMLPYLAVGFGLVLVWEFVLRAMRARLIAQVASRVDYLISTAGFSHLLHLPSAYTDRATVGAQFSRMREFDGMRDLFASPISTAVLDFPFALILIAVIGVIAWPLAVIPVGAMLVLGAIVWLMSHMVGEASRVSSVDQAARHSFIVETLGKMRAIKLLSAEDIWRERFQQISADAAMSGFRMRFVTSVLQTIGQVSVIGAGATTLALGTFLVFAGDLSTGGLIACLALTWRALSPLVTLISSASRFSTIRNTIRRFNNLMQLTSERTAEPEFSRQRVTKGQIEFNRVSLRYVSNAEPALLGVSFKVEPGEVVAVVGATGSGKSSLAKLSAGLYTPQAGSVSIDGIDVRQLDAIELRQMVSYVPQNDHFFYGTIAQNLRLARPDASEHELHAATKAARIEKDIEALPEKFETRIGDTSINQLPPGFSRRLALARAYLRGAPIMMFDEPADGLDEDADKAFIEAVQALAGKTTVIMITHRPSHMSLADKIFYLREGRLELAGPAPDILQIMRKNGLI